MPQLHCTSLFFKIFWSELALNHHCGSRWDAHPQEPSNFALPFDMRYYPTNQNYINPLFAIVNRLLTSQRGRSSSFSRQLSNQRILKPLTWTNHGIEIQLFCYIIKEKMIFCICLSIPIQTGTKIVLDKCLTNDSGLLVQYFYSMNSRIQCCLKHSSIKSVDQSEF